MNTDKKKISKNRFNQCHLCAKIDFAGKEYFKDSAVVFQETIK